MKAAGKTLRLSELLEDSANPDLRLYVETDDGAIALIEADNGLLIPDEALFNTCYVDAHELLQQIKEDPKVWTKKKILAAIDEYLV